MTLGLLLLAGGLVAPAPAVAAGGLVDGVPDPVDAVDAVGGAVGGAATSGFREILEALFGGLEAKITLALLRWLVTVPDFAGGDVAGLARTTTAIAFGLLGAVMTLATIRYWLSGLSGGAGGAEAIEGLTRTVAAALVIVLWPWLFARATGLANAASGALLGSPGVADDLARLFRAAIVAHFTLAPVGWLISIIVALAGTLMLLGLVLLKVVLGASTALLFVAMPLAVVLWPIAETAWVARLAARGLMVCLLTPLAWVVVFAAFAAVGVDALSFDGDGPLDEAVIRPLTGCALLFVAVTLPRTLMRAAMLGAPGPGRGASGRIAVATATRRVDAAIATQLPAGIGGTRSQPRPTASAGGARTAGDAIEPRPPVSTVGSTASARPAENGAARADGSRSPGPPTARTDPGPAGGPGRDVPDGRAVAGATGAPDPAQDAGAARGPVVDGADTPAVAPPFHIAAFRREQRMADERAASDPPGRDEVSAAYRALSPQQQARVDAAVSGPAERQRATLAHEASASWNSPAQTAALRTLAAAAPPALQHGVADARARTAAGPVVGAADTSAAGGSPAPPPSPQAAPAPRSAAEPAPAAGVPSPDPPPPAPPAAPASPEREASAGPEPPGSSGADGPAGEGRR